MESGRPHPIHHPSLAIGALALAIAVLLPLFGAVLSALGAILAVDARREYRVTPGLALSAAAMAVSIVSYTVAAVVIGVG